MKPLFTGEELQALGQIDAGLERLPLSAGEWMEAEARDRAIQREERGARHKDRPGRGLATLEAGWFERVRAARFRTPAAAARACGVSPKLMWMLECGGVTAPALARRVGRGDGADRRRGPGPHLRRNVGAQKARGGRAAGRCAALPRGA
jgi:hypothetical protein